MQHDQCALLSYRVVCFVQNQDQITLRHPKRPRRQDELSISSQNYLQRDQS